MPQERPVSADGPPADLAGARVADDAVVALEVVLADLRAGSRDAGPLAGQADRKLPVACTQTRPCSGNAVPATLGALDEVPPMSLAAAGHGFTRGSYGATGLSNAPHIPLEALPLLTIRQRALRPIDGTVTPGPQRLTHSESGRLQRLNSA